MKDKTIAVVMGGPSKEREISLNTGNAIYEALLEKGYKVKAIDLVPDKFAEQLKDNEVDIVFNAVHGLYGEDGRMQGFLDMLGIPYTGSGVEANALAMDKVISKQMFHLEDIPTPRYVVVKKSMAEEVQINLVESLGFPSIIKPSEQGSTIGVTKVTERTQIKDALSLAFVYGDNILVEEFISGREFTVSVLAEKTGARALPVIEITPHSGAYDYHSKYTVGATTYTVPAQVDMKTAAFMQDYSVKIFELFGCRGVARVDYMMDSENNFYALEINTVPGMTATSLVPKAAASEGVSFPDLCEKILLSVEV